MRISAKRDRQPSAKMCPVGRHFWRQWGRAERGDFFPEAVVALNHSLRRAGEPSPQRAESSRMRSSPRGEVRQRSTFPVMGRSKLSVGCDPTTRPRSSLPRSYTQARIEALTWPTEPWRLTWRVMSVLRTGRCGSTIWWDRWILGRERLAHRDRLADREGRRASSLSHAS